jgi:hypothetical protein
MRLCELSRTLIIHNDFSSWLFESVHVQPGQIVPPVCPQDAGVQFYAEPSDEEAPAETLNRTIAAPASGRVEDERCSGLTIRVTANGGALVS